MQHADYNVKIASTPAQIKQILVDEEYVPDLVLMDLSLGLGQKMLDGINMIRTLKNEYHINCGFVIVSGFILPNEIKNQIHKLRDEGVLIASYIQKPIPDA